MKENYKCEFCERSFNSAPALWSHKGKCKQNPNATNKELSEKQKQRNLNNKGHFYIKKIQCFCEFCGREFNYKNNLTLHLKTCKQNPNRDIEYSKHLSEIQKKAITQEKREASSKRTVFNNFWKYRAKNPIIYESPIAGKMKLDSNWELITAKRLDELQVEWYRPRIGLPYFDLDGVQHTYIPDFYCKTYNCFIEVKSDFIKKFQNSSSNKADYLKEHYKFIKWLETEDACKTFQLSDLGCNFMPEKDEEDISYWLEKAETLKKEKDEKRKLRERNKIIKQQNLEKAKALKEAEYKKIIEKSNIDFSKFGWVGQLSNLLNLSSKYVRKHIPQMFPDINFFTRQGENSNAHKHWWTNGIDEVSATSCPVGWWSGRSNMSRQKSKK